MSTRIEATVERLQLRPSDFVLEIGCGHGVAVDLICRRLQRGKIIAIDRSPKMITAASCRNAAHVAAGLAEFRVADLETFDPSGLQFDAILALRVALFHREPKRAHLLVTHWLKPGGRILAVYDEPR